MIDPKVSGLDGKEGRGDFHHIALRYKRLVDEEGRFFRQTGRNRTKFSGVDSCQRGSGGIFRSHAPISQEDRRNCPAELQVIGAVSLPAAKVFGLQ